MAYRWRKTDESIDLVHCSDHEQRSLYYGRIYTIKQGYQYSETNNYIYNLKISNSDIQTNPRRKRYKLEAIEQFAKEITALIQALRQDDDSINPLLLVPMPPSKKPSDPEYDDRMEQVGKLVADTLENVLCLPVLSMAQSVESYHSRSDARNPEQIYQLLKLDPNLLHNYSEHSNIALIDDVLTSGAHYAAATRRLEEFFANVRVIGIFWAKAMSSPEEYPEN
jgi:hypothetical protein